MVPPSAVLDARRSSTPSTPLASAARWSYTWMETPTGTEPVAATETGVPTARAAAAASGPRAAGAPTVTVVAAGQATAGATNGTTGVVATVPAGGVTERTRCPGTTLSRCGRGA